MKIARLGSLLVLLCSLPLSAQTTPWVTDPAQEPDRGVPFPLPQERNAAGRRVLEGGSNALTISWDGRLLMYVDSGNDAGEAWEGLGAIPTNGMDSEGIVFSTFDKSRVVADVDGKPDFSDCFGDQPLARFANTRRDELPDGSNTYPVVGGGYPTPTPPGGTTISMGELGLFRVEYLSANLYPAETAAPGNENPFPGNSDGTYNAVGNYRVYDAWVLLQDLTKFWHAGSPPQIPNPGRWLAYNAVDDTDYHHKYENGTYPNGVLGSTTLTAKRNGLCKLRMIVLPGSGATKDEVVQVDVLQKWTPFTVSGDDVDFSSVSGPVPGVGITIPSSDTMYADNFEPNLTFDGHFMVGKGSPLLVRHDLPSRVNFYYNPVAFAFDGWRGPYELTQLYDKRNVVLDGSTIAERYPMARHPVKDYDGTVLPSTYAFEGGYTWLSPDGRYVLYTCNTAGVGKDHPETTLNADGGGSSNRAHVSLFGSVTGWQLWRIDHAAVNPTRHMFTGWDQDSRTTHQRVASFGFSPGFWDMLRGADAIPMHDTGATKVQMVNNQQLRYFELDLSPYQERDYGFYLPMSVMLTLLDPGGANTREVDLTRTPDLSGNGNVGIIPATNGGQLPCEYFDLPSFTSNGLEYGLYSSTGTIANIHPTWTVADVIEEDPPGSGKYWAPIADWVDGKDTGTDGAPDTTPFDGRGDKRDMDSDVSWGRVGQAMFFKGGTSITVANSGSSSPELNPGTTAPNATDELTVSCWVRPLQGRTSVAVVLDHHVSLGLRPDGAVGVRVLNEAGSPTLYWSPGGAAPDLAWTHLATTWRKTGLNESESRLYVNGVEVASQLALPFETLQLTSDPILIGCPQTVAAGDPNAAVLLLDEVALKNSALVADDVAELALLPITPPTWESPSFFAGAGAPFTAEDERVPLGAAYDEDLARIGADIFHDVQLSSSKTISCASCHDPANGFVDGLTVAKGENGDLLRNTSTLYNALYNEHQFWDGRAVNLEDQALDPVFTPDEMGFTEWADVEGYFQTDDGYQDYFAPTVDEDDVRLALATYMRTLTASGAPGDNVGPGSLEEHGKILFFGKARCSGCHNGPGFTDGRLWTTGTFREDGADDGAFNDHPDLAAAGTAGRERFRGAFKTPTLRELDRTAPYFHDGSSATLRDVVLFYNRGGVRTDGAGFDLLEAGHEVVAEETNRKLGLDETPGGEVDALVAYLESLTAGSAGSFDGPSGFNKKPTITIEFPGSGYQLPFPLPDPPPVLIFEIKDADGQDDFDPTMTWTLEIESGSTTYTWASSAVTRKGIRNGYEVTLSFYGGLPAGTRVRVADHHGLWTDWVTVN